MSDFEGITLPTYVISSAEDDLQTVSKTFSSRSEFDIISVHPTSAEKNITARFRASIVDGIQNDEDCLIICLSNGYFTRNYNKLLLISQIIEANDKGCDILFGGVAGFNNAIPIGRNLFWIDKFSLTTFMVIYKRFFQRLLNESLSESSEISSISSISSNKLTIYPFIHIGSLLDEKTCSSYGSLATEATVPTAYVVDEEKLQRILFIKSKFDPKSPLFNSNAHASS